MQIFDETRVEEVAASSLVDELDLSMFSDRDILNTVLQRSEVLFDVLRGGSLVRQWSNGNPKALEAEVAARGLLLLKRAIAILYLEYEALKPVIAQISPNRVADIGCGYAFIDLFIARDFSPEILLIDLEQNDLTHFGFQSEGAAYSNLGTAKAFLAANGVSARKIKTLNPEKEDVDKVRDVDLAMSLLSCGFHYPASTYADFWADSVSDTGAIILDLRTGQAENQLTDMIHVGAVRALWKGKKWNRVLVQKDSS